MTLIGFRITFYPLLKKNFTMGTYTSYFLWIVIETDIFQFPINFHILPYCGKNIVIKMPDSQ